jgi:hypothetical protein
MSGRSKDWRTTYAAAKLELDPTKQCELCKQARQLMQERLVELAAGGGQAEERNELEAALRELWVIEQQIQKPDVQ